MQLNCSHGAWKAYLRSTSLPFPILLCRASGKMLQTCGSFTFQDCLKSLQLLIFFLINFFFLSEKLLQNKCSSIFLPELSLFTSILAMFRVKERGLWTAFFFLEHIKNYWGEGLWFLVKQLPPAHPSWATPAFHWDEVHFSFWFRFRQGNIRKNSFFSWEPDFPHESKGHRSSHYAHSSFQMGKINWKYHFRQGNTSQQALGSWHCLYREVI